MVIVHTSGSTSAPKGVIHQHGPLLRHLDNLNSIRRYTAGEMLFSNSPFFWIGGFAYSLLGTLVAGATLLCSNADRPGATLDFVERERPDWSTASRQRSPHLATRPDVRAAATSRRSARGNLWPIMPAAVRPPTPSCATTCSA